MDLERLALSPEQQQEIDAFFLETAINALNQKAYYRDRALLMTGSPDLPNELEAIHARVYDQAHVTNIESPLGSIQPVVIANLGRLAFIDSLALPSAEKVWDWKPSLITLGMMHRGTKTKEVEVALSDWSDYRRLFRGLPHTSTVISTPKLS